MKEKTKSKLAKNKKEVDKFLMEFIRRSKELENQENAFRSKVMAYHDKSLISQVLN